MKRRAATWALFSAFPLLIVRQHSLLVCHPAADVLTIENSRSGDEMIRALADFGYLRDLGPGVYDVHR